MRVLYASDMHGSTRVWVKWLNAAVEMDADVAICGGDVSGKALVPVVNVGGGRMVARYFGQEWALGTSDEVSQFLGRVEASGAYGVQINSEQLGEWQRDQSRAVEVLDELIQERLRKWLSIAADMQIFGNRVGVVIPGNDDERYCDDVLATAADGLVPALGKVVEVEDIEIVSLDVTTPTPWNTPREADESELERLAQVEAGRVRDPRRAIFNFHCPPKQTRVDQAPKLDKHHKPVIAGGEVVLEHVGSKAIRKVIEERQPLLSMHGHVHESAGVDRIGNTICTNAGSEYGEGILRGIVVDIPKGSDKCEIVRIER